MTLFKYITHSYTTKTFYPGEKRRKISITHIAGKLPGYFQVTTEICSQPMPLFPPTRGGYMGGEKTIALSRDTPCRSLLSSFSFNVWGARHAAMRLHLRFHETCFLGPINGPILDFLQLCLCMHMMQSSCSYPCLAIGSQYSPGSSPEERRKKKQSASGRLGAWACTLLRLDKRGTYTESRMTVRIEPKVAALRSSS